MEKMFSERDRVIKVDHFGIVSKMSSWRLDTISKWMNFFLKALILLWVWIKRDFPLIKLYAIEVEF